MAFDTRNVAPITESELARATEDAVAQLRRSLPLFTSAAQNHSSVGNFYTAVPNELWTTGFWPGSIWLAWELSGEEAFRTSAQIQVQALKHRIEKRIATDHHDMGFLYTPSCVAAWKLVGDEDGRSAALLAADQLVERFHEKGEFLQAWGEMGAEDNYRYIIDCLLNLPLLYWASDETGNPRYRDIARRHTETTLAHSIRDDFSTWHTFFFDMETGAPLKGVTQQGFDDDSSWTRGQAWAITGVAFMARLDPSDRLHALFDQLLDYYLARLPDDLVPYWDLIFAEGDAEPRDSSSAAIVACGLLEMAGLRGGAEGDRMRDLAARMTGALARDYAVRDLAVSNGLLLHGTYSKKTPYNRCRGEGVDECVSWGDYFYMEALTRLSRDWAPYW